MRKTAITIAALALWLIAAIAPAHALIGQSPLTPSGDVSEPISGVDMKGNPEVTVDLKGDPIVVRPYDASLVKPAR